MTNVPPPKTPKGFRGLTPAQPKTPIREGGGLRKSSGPATAETQVKRYITVWDKKGDRYCGEIELLEVPFELLQRVFCQEQGNPMYACYPIRNRHWKALKKYLNTPLDFERFEYYLECEAI